MLNYFSMILKIFNFKLILLILITFSLTACGGKWGSDARKVSPDPAERVKKNLEEGRGFRLNNLTKGQGGTTYEFASSNELWRASLDTIDFMPLTTANYNGGIIVTDWYSEDQKVGEAVKITIRFLTNEVRSDALDIKIFNRKCLNNLLNCKFTQTDGVLVTELKKEILKKAAIYKENKDKKD